MKKTVKYLLASGLLMVPLVALAQVDFGTNYLGSIGLGTSDVRVTIVNIIRVALGILGVVLLLLIIYGVVGSMSGGEDAKSRATKIIGGAVIGLIIIVVSYAATTWIMNSILEVTN